MAASINANMFLCARVIAGIGIGFINAIIPPWVSELSESHDRGATFSLVFVSNFLGIVIAYWINFGIRNMGVEFRWRFPLAFMLLPMLIVAMTVVFLPESPRWLIANGRRDEAIEILTKLRGDLSPTDPKMITEIEQLDAVVEAGNHKRNNLLNIFLGGRYSGKLHLGRRALMGFALQLIQRKSKATCTPYHLLTCRRMDRYSCHRYLGRCTVQTGRIRRLQIGLAGWSRQHLWYLRYGSCCFGH